MERISYKKYKQAVYVILNYNSQNEQKLLTMDFLDSDSVNPSALFRDVCDSLRLDKRISAYFREKGVIPSKVTLLDVSRLSYDDLKKIGGLGRKAIKELDTLLGHAGLNIKP